MSASTHTSTVRAHSRIAGCLVAALLAALANAGDPELKAANGLRAKYVELRAQLGNNQFGRPLYLESAESADGVAGDVYALIDHPFAAAVAALDNPGDWCEILILHINTKYCRALKREQASVLEVSIGRKRDQPLADAFPVEFVFRAAARTTDYLQVTLNAAEGPLSTRDYRIVFEAVAVDGARTFVHLSYSYRSAWRGGWRCRSISAPSAEARLGSRLRERSRMGSPSSSTEYAAW